MTKTADYFVLRSIWKLHFVFSKLSKLVAEFCRILIIASNRNIQKLY